MAEIDGNGPTIQVNVDTKQAQEDIKNLDQVTAEAVEGMNKKFNSFNENVKKTFSDLKNGGGLFSNPSSNAESGGGATASQNVAKDNQEKQYKAKKLDYERQAMQARKRQEDLGKQLLASTKSMGLALAGFAGFGLGAKAMLDFSHNMAQLQNLLKASNSDPTKALAYRNEFRNRNVDDNSYWAAFQGINNTLVKMQYGEAGKLPENQAWALNKLHDIDPTIQTNVRQGGALRTDEQLRRVVNAAQKLKAKNPQWTNNQIVKLLQDAIPEADINFAQAALNGKIKISKADMAKAKSEADALPALAKLDAEKQRLATSFETEQAKFIAAISPLAIDFMKGLNSFVSNYGAIAMAGTALFSFGGAIVSFLSIMKLGKSILPTLAIDTAKAAPKGGVGSAIWRGAKGAGGKIWDGTKWIAGKGVEASEWVERNPKALAKGGGRLAGAAPMVAWDLTAGNITDAQATSMWDGIARKDKNGQWNRTGRARNIERELNARVLQSSWNKKYYVETKDGVYVYIDSEFYEPIEQIKRRLQNGQKDIPNQPESPSLTKRISEAVMPSARAGERVAWPNGKASGASWSHAKVSREEQERIAKLIRDGAANNGYKDFQADASITSVNRESGFDIHAVGDNGRSKGLFQFDKYRQSLFQKRYGHPIERSTADEQVDFHFWEMKNNEKKAGDLLKKSRNDVEANTIMVRNYERSRDQESDIQKQLNFLPQARAMGRGRMQLPSLPPSQVAAQARANQIRNDTRNVTTNNGGNTANNNTTVNIHVEHGTVDNIKKGVREGLKGFPSASNFNLVTGVS